STAMKPANKANEPTAEASTGANAAEPVERRAGAKGNAHQHNTYWTQSQARVTNALGRIRPLSPSRTRGGSRMRESRTYGSVRGACDETHVPTATAARVHHDARRRGHLRITSEYDRQAHRHQLCRDRRVEGPTLLRRYPRP